MPCRWVNLPGVGDVLVNMQATRARTCSVCRRKTQEYKLCDYQVGMGSGKKPKTCDAVLCKACTSHKEPDTDYCPLHARAVEGRLKL